ncbi:thioredoxin domain-containing protein [Mucilaginibacter sp. cycad4]|uniref:thioredoxin family protein n=1 Tax=Mucilaginibacter sp. cycad4 TaxID=3342096 RepID=UPI002AAB8426|nr:thioredoxin family protein [Mucilaginibacter gossypii]WPU98647.1 thioredoxin domain-containing protein [Mucilaginibacter gossypii]
MKKLLHISYFIAILALVPGPAAKAQETISKSSTQINFIENSWNEALKQAARQNKYIFVDAYASWCGPCKMLKATTFKNNKVADFYNDNFVNVAIDMEKGQGPALATEWGLQAYPTMIIFTSKGKPVSGTVGYIRANDLIKFGRQALNK